MEKLADKPADNDVDAIADTLGRMRLLIGRRVIGRAAIAQAAPGLDISFLDALSGVRRAEGEVTVGTVAELLRVDPSRGSRIVAELVERGLLRRAVSQEDGRRSVLALTDAGSAVLDHTARVKMALVREVVDGWDEEDLQRFAELFDRFTARFEDVANRMRQQDGEAEAAV